MNDKGGNLKEVETPRPTPMRTPGAGPGGAAVGGSKEQEKDPWAEVGKSIK